MSRPELFVSLDIETDGPAPGVNSMLSLGAALYRQDGEECGEWYQTIHPIPLAEPNPETMDWWRHPDRAEAWEEVNRNPRYATQAIPDFVQWLEMQKGFKLIAVGWPIAFDFAFVNYYCHAFVGRNPLGFAGLDIRSYINGILNQPSYYGMDEADLRRVSGEIDKTGLRPHIALDDAKEQGRLFMAVRNHVILTGQMVEAVDKHQRESLLGVREEGTHGS